MKKLINRLTDRWINKVLVTLKERQSAKKDIFRLKRNIRKEVKDFIKICKDIDAVKTAPNGNVDLFDSNGNVATLWIHNFDEEPHKINSIGVIMHNYNKFNYKKGK